MCQSFSSCSLADESLVDGSDEVADLDFITNNQELLIERPVLFGQYQFSLELMLEFYSMEI